MKLMCEVADCGNELTEGTGSKGGPMICKWCRGTSYYWKKQGIKAMRHRHTTLGLYRNRLEFYDARVTEIQNKAKKAVNAAKQRARDAVAVH